MTKLITTSFIVGLVAAGAILVADIQNYNNDCRASKERIEYFKTHPAKPNHLGFKTMDEVEQEFPPNCQSISTVDFANSALGGLLIAFGFYIVGLFAKLLFKLEKLL